MKKTALALVSAIFLLAACSDGTDSSTTGGTGDGRGIPDTVRTIGEDSQGSISDRVFFELNSSVLSADAQATLARQAEYLKANSMNVTLEGHCDERGTREYNIALGERRASAAKNFLVSLGVPAGSISTISYGKERPAVVGHDESAWSQNRRAVTVQAN